MHFSILTLFPDIFEKPLHYSILKRAKDEHILTIDIIDIRDFSTDSYKTVDDHPYGGGAGMILKVDVIDRAISHVTSSSNHAPYIVLFDAGGELFKQRKAVHYAQKDHILLICGHYEGVDARVVELVDDVISIGEYVLTGGEFAAMTVLDSVTRLLPGVLKPESTKNESFTLSDDKKPLLEYPQYTRPQIYNGMEVPDVLLSGNHKQIEDWRMQQSRKRTKKRKNTV